MKKIYFSMFLTLNFSNLSFASTDFHSVLIQNTGTVDSFLLNSIATRTEYRTEEVQSTCYRQVFDGYQTVCDRFVELISPIAVRDVGPHPDPGPHPDDPGRVEKPGPGHPDFPSEPNEPREPACHEEATYRDEAYSCVQTVSVPYEVYDHDASANVNVKVSAVPESTSQTGNCGIQFSLSGDNLSASNTCPSYIATANITKNGAGYDKNYSYLINLFDAQKLLAPLSGKLTNLHIENGILIAKTGNLTNAKNFSLKLFVKRNRFLIKDIVIIDRMLTAKEFSYEAIDDQTGNVKINLEKLAGDMNNLKYTIKLCLDVTLPSGVLLNNNLPNMHQENSIIVKK